MKSSRFADSRPPGGQAVVNDETLHATGSTELFGFP